MTRASINKIFSWEPKIFTQSNGQKSLSGLMWSNNRDVLKWCINYSKIMPPHRPIFRWLMRKFPICRKSFSQWSLKGIFIYRCYENKPIMPIQFELNWTTTVCLILFQSQEALKIMCQSLVILRQVWKKFLPIDLMKINLQCQYSLN